MCEKRGGGEGSEWEGAWCGPYLSWTIDILTSRLDLLAIYLQQRKVIHLVRVLWIGFHTLCTLLRHIEEQAARGSHLLPQLSYSTHRRLCPHNSVHDYLSLLQVAGFCTEMFMRGCIVAGE